MVKKMLKTVIKGYPCDYEDRCRLDCPRYGDDCDGWDNMKPNVVLKSSGEHYICVKKPLSYFEKKGYIIDDAFYEEYKDEIEND